MLARVAVKGKRFRAYVGGRNVTKSFRKGKKGIRRARLSVKDELERGRTDLFVRAGPKFRGATDSVRFHLNPRRDDALRMTARPKRRSHAAPKIRGKLAKPIEELRVRLNGRRIDEELNTSSSKVFEGRLGSHAGLRYGRNKVRIKAFLRNGRAAAEKFAFKVPRKRPLVGAGPDLTTAVGSPTALDGRATRPAVRGRPLTYRWRLIDKPKGSKARISGRTRRMPTITPDAPGRYVAQLRASQSGRAATRDTVTLTTRASDEVLGIPIQTITADGGIQIGHPADKGSVKISRFGTWVQLVQLDSETGGILAETVPLSFTPAESGELVKAVNNVDENALVVLTGQGRPQPNAGARPAADLEKAIEKLGGTLEGCGGCPTPTPNKAEDLNKTGAWSLIGMRDLTPGYATQNFGLTRAGLDGFLAGAAGQAGSVNGYLGQVPYEGYRFVSAEYVGIDTRYTPNPTSQPPKNQNTIAITRPDGTVETHDSGPPIPNGSVAIHALVLDGSDLSPIDNNTNAIINADGSTNYGQIAFLNELLDATVRKSPPGTSPVVILQEFGGHSGRAWPGGDSTDWIADTLPTTDPDTAWDGSRMPSSPSAQAQMWNQAGQRGSVAGNIGVLAGPSAHDVIANYRRPYWDSSWSPPANSNEPENVNPHNTTGLTVIASANAYQRSGAFVSPQPAPSDTSGGRIAGILRRNGQSQWELGGHSSTAGNQKLQDGGVFATKEFWDLAFATTPEPFPCSGEQPAGCPDGLTATAAELAAAESDIGRRLWGTSDVRSQYAARYDADFKDGKATNRLRDLSCQGAPTSRECVVFAGLKRQLLTEFDDVQGVADGIDQWRSFFTYTIGEREKEIILKSISNKVIDDVLAVEDKLLDEKAETEAGAGASDSLLLISELIESGIAVGAPEALAIAPPALGAIAAAMDLSDEISTPQYGADDAAVVNEPDAINVEVNSLSESISSRYATVSDTMLLFGSTFVNDWARLQQASDSFEQNWQFLLGDDQETGNKFVQAANLATAQAVWEALLPIAYRQWIVSPRYTRLNGLAALDLPKANTYTCWDSNDANDGNIPPNEIDDRNPIRGSTPRSSQTSVAWYGSTELGSQTGAFNGPLANYTVRFLKSSVDNLRPQTYPLTDDSNEVGVQHAGTDAKASLLDPLFATPRITDDIMEPQRYGMTKDEFFGSDNWTIQKLQCGTSDGF